MNLKLFCHGLNRSKLQNMLRSSMVAKGPSRLFLLYAMGEQPPYLILRSMSDITTAISAAVDRTYEQ